MSSAVVVPTTSTGAPQPSGATAVTAMKGGMLLSPLPLGGGSKRKTKKVPKKILKLFKKGSAKKLGKLMKGGADAMEEVAAEAPEAAEEGGRRGKKSRKTRRGSRKSRRGHAFLY